MLPLVTGAALALLDVLAAQDVPAPERYAAVRAQIEADVAAGRTPAMAVAVLEDGEVAWAQGFGTADPVRGTPASADTIWRLASISKPFTATALMMLVERGQLDLDVEVNRWLPHARVVAYRGSAGDVTLRRLCNHTAGLPTHWNFFYGDESPPPRAQTIAAYGFAAFAPGTRTNYSNLAFGIVDHVIATTAQRSYREFLVQEVLDPLGMLHTDVGVRPGKEALAAAPCRKDGDRFVVVPDYGFDHDGASAVRSSARDLMRFARFVIGDGELDGRRVLAAATVRAMQEPRGRAAGSDFGVGWSVGQVRGTRVLRHTGGMPGVSTVLQVFPERRAAIAVLTNGGDRGQAVLAAALDVLLGKEPAAVGAGSGERSPAKTPGRAPDPAPPEAGRFRGLIAHPDGSIPCALEIDADGAVRLTLNGESVGGNQGKATATSVALRARHTFATGHASDKVPQLDLELERDGGGWQGILYATVDGVCRLPHWVQLAPEAAKAPATHR